MTTTGKTTVGKQAISTLTSDGTLTLEVVAKEFPAPTGNQVLVRMEAAPINPSDLFLMTTGVELAKAQFSPGKMVVQLHPQASAAQAGRHDQPQTMGNEGAGTVVAAGDGEQAHALIGQRVSCVPGCAFGEYALSEAMMCLPLGEHSSEAGAASFVNPMTALGFAGTAKREGAKAIIHAAAASNLGQMLNRICIEDGLGLVNIVRREEHVALLRDAGASHVINSSLDSFEADLVSAIEDTGAFLGFDPIGGGHMSDTCLRAMEKVAAAKLTDYSRYGSDDPKKMYIYGRLDLSPTVLTPTYGFSWTLAGWLLPQFLMSLDMEEMMALRTRVLEGLTTTFASSYKKRVNLEEMLTEEAMREYAQMATGEKYLVVP